MDPRSPTRASSSRMTSQAYYQWQTQVRRGVRGGGKLGGSPGVQAGGRGRGTHGTRSRTLQTKVTRLSNPYYVGTEHVGFSPTRQASRAPSAKRLKVFGVAYEW